jgi:succinate-semialdehyde dehydrogenase/glutarate-semialdehyde dehydrogenase
VLFWLSARQYKKMKESEDDSMTYPELELLVDGQWLGAEKNQRNTQPVHNPATGELLGQLPMALEGDVEQAIEAAHHAFAPWKTRTALERGRLLSRIASAIREQARSLAQILTLEQGKTLPEALGEVTATADTFEWMAEQGKRVYGRVVPSRFMGVEQLVVHEPVGVIGAFSPWNYPMVLAARKVATALAAGCTIVIKPAEETPGVMIAIARICMDAGLPSGVLNVLYGVPDMVSRRLIASPKVAQLSFTGSVPVGRHLLGLASAAMKKITLELGGHSPVIVDRDVPVERVAELAAAAKFRNAGQICHAPTRFIVHDSVADAFERELAKRAGQLRLGNGIDEAVQMGPLVNRRRQAAMRELTDDAVKSGARLLCGGTEPEGLGDGSFWQPTVLADVGAAARAMHEEVFGPIALVSRFDTLEQAIETANDVEFGLAAYAFTRSAESMQRLQGSLQAGSVSINTFAVTPPELPFAGIKLSGMGAEMGEEGLMDHFHTKAVVRTGTI